MIRDLLLMRHGQTDWNLEDRIQGTTDVPLNATGRAQVLQTTAHLEATLDPAQICLWSSPQRRAYESAEIVAGALGLEIQVHADLREMGLGLWEGKLKHQLQAEEPRWQSYLEDPGAFVFPEGESMVGVRRRVLDAVVEIGSAASCPTALLVVHGGVIRALTLGLLDLPGRIHHQLSVANASLTHLRLGSKPRLLLFNGSYLRGGG